MGNKKDYTDFYNMLLEQLRQSKTVEDEFKVKQHVKSTINNYLSKDERLFEYKKQFNEFIRSYNTENEESFITKLSEKVGYDVDQGIVYKNCLKGDAGDWGWIKISRDDNKIEVYRYYKQLSRWCDVYDNIKQSRLPENHVASFNLSKVRFETRIAKRLLGALDCHTNRFIPAKKYVEQVKKQTKKGVWKLLDRVYNDESDEQIINDITTKRTGFLPVDEKGDYLWGQLLSSDEDKIAYLAFYEQKYGTITRMVIGSETLSELNRTIRKRASQIIEIVREKRLKVSQTLRDYEILYVIQQLIIRRKQQKAKITDLINDICSQSYDQLKEFSEQLTEQEQVEQFGIFRINDYINTQKLYAFVANKVFEYNFNVKAVERDHEVRRILYVATMQNKKYGTLLKKFTDVICFDIDNMGGNNAKQSLKYLISKFHLVPDNFVYAEYSAIGSGGLHVYIKLPHSIEINKYRSELEKQLNSDGDRKIEIRGSSHNTVLPLGLDYFPVDVKNLFQSKFGIIKQQEWKNFIQDVLYSEKTGNYDLYNALMQQDVIEVSESKQNTQQKPDTWVRIERQGCHEMLGGQAVLNPPTLPLRRGNSNNQILWLADWYRNVLNKSFKQYFDDIQQSKNLANADANIYNEPCFTSEKRYLATWNHVKGSTYYNSFQQQGGRLRKSPQKFISNFDKWEPSSYHMLNAVGPSLSAKFCKILAQRRKGLCNRKYIKQVGEVLCSAFTAVFYAKALWEVTNPSYIVTKASGEKIANLRGVPVSIKYIKAFMQYVCDEIRQQSYHEIEKYVDCSTIEQLSRDIDEIEKMLCNNIEIWRDVLIKTFGLKYTEYNHENFTNGICKCVDLRNDHDVNKSLRQLMVDNVKDSTIDLISIKNITKNKQRDEINVNGFYQISRDKKFIKKLFSEGETTTKQSRLGYKTINRTANKFKNQNYDVQCTNDVHTITQDDNCTKICFAVFARIKIIAKMIATWVDDLFADIDIPVDDYCNHDYSLCGSSPPIT